LKVCLDTNVLASAMFGSGLCVQLFDRLIALGAVVMTTAQVLHELRRVGRDKFRVPEPDLSELLDWLGHRLVVVPDGSADRVPDCPDPDDSPILHGAMLAGADWFVTGDKALLDLGALGEMAILSPRAVYERLIALR
jgi:putative PIN family toxin of toxin-antitoxin system